MKKRKTSRFLFRAEVKGRVGVGEQERSKQGMGVVEMEAPQMLF